VSLIQEALKRQHEDIGRNSAPPPLEDKAPTLKSKPADTPEHGASPASSAGSGEGRPATASATQAASEIHVMAQVPRTQVAEERRSKAPILIVAIALVLLFVALGVGGWLVVGRVRESNKPAPLPPVAPSTPLTVLAASPSVSNQAALQRIQPIPIPSNTAATAVLQTQPVELPPPATTSIVKTVVVPPPPAPVVWPILKVNALLRTSKMGSVMINNSELIVGDEIDGVRVTDIDVSMVTLQYKGETRKLRTGDITK